MLNYLPSLFDNFGRTEKFSYTHAAQISVTVNTYMPRNDKKQKQKNNIRAHSGRKLTFAEYILHNQLHY
jgi:hypothetical protein